MKKYHEVNNEPVLETEIDYAYDAFGSLIERVVLEGGNSPAHANMVQRYALDGWNPAKLFPTGNENWDVYADLDGNGSLTTRYFRGDKVDEVIARIEGGTNPYWYLVDNLASIRAVIDGSGNLKDELAYDGYGNITY